MAGKTPAATLTMQLLVDTKAQRVLYAEGSKDVVDFLLSLLAVPLAGVTKLLTAGAMVGSVGNLYGSVVDKLGAHYDCRGDVKAALLTPTAVLRLDSPADAYNGGSLYRCSGCACSKSCYNFVTKVNGTQCPVCKRKMTTEVSLVEPDDVSGVAKIVTSPATSGEESSSNAGYPPGKVTYTVMDDLTVAPSSTVAAVAALVALGVTDIRGLQEKTVEVGYEEGLAVLKASLQSKTVLTDVFLGARRTAHRRPPMLTNSTKASSDQMSMTLLVDTKAQRVLYAEARKDVVDFLFSLLALPVASAVKLLGKDSMVGCVGNLYLGVEKLDAAYVQPGASKDALLRPVVLSPVATSNSSVLGLPAPPARPAPPPPSKNFFRCNFSYIYEFDGDIRCRGNYVTDASGVNCPSCRGQMATECQYVAPLAAQKVEVDDAAVAAAKGAKGFVQGIVTYTVMDDLTIAPMSSISSIALLNKFAVKDLGALKEQTVQLGYTEGLAILKASLQSKTVLTDDVGDSDPLVAATDDAQSCYFQTKAGAAVLATHKALLATMATETNTSKASGALSMKLLVDTKAQLVLYAEAGKDVVDFLFSLLTLPVGTVLKDSMVGSIGKLYRSVEENVLLAPAGGFCFGNLLQLPATELYRCSASRSGDCYNYVSTVSGLPCQLPHCNGKMTLPVKHVVSSSSTTGSTGGEAAAHAPSAVAGSGFVQGLVTYAIMDDLKVAPMSTITLVKSGVTSIKPLQEKTVQIGYTEAKRVLYAEARKDVVDFLLSLLTLPIASGIKLLGKNSMVGCVGNLYASVEKLDDAFVQADAAKDSLLSPVVLSPAASSNISVLRLPVPSSAQPKSFFRCPNNSYNACRSYVTDTSGTKCPACHNQMLTACTYVAGDPDKNTLNAAAEGAKGGFVQGIVTYTVMDDLTVAPMSSISSITLLNKFAVKDLGALKEQTVQIGYIEGLAILKASLQSKTVLTDAEGVEGGLVEGADAVATAVEVDEHGELTSIVAGGGGGGGGRLVYPDLEAVRRVQDGQRRRRAVVVRFG
uniref:DUF674 domain-containing protein n=1 Tax=Oryza punctata TaxID=4537 RepID=A0A0E0JE71_ORYPU